MSLTKKDKEEIAKIVAETLNNIQAGAEKVEQGNIKFELEQLDKKWRENGIESESTGLIIAPENVNIDGVTVFTWDEAMCLEAKGKTPKGWRLPTRHEWVLICEEFGMDEATGGLSTEKISKALNFPRDEDDQLCGGFWSSTAYSDSAHAYYLYYSPSYVDPRGNSLKYFEFSVRLVKE